MKRNRLTARFVETIQRPGRYTDGLGSNGLALLVKPSGTKSWVQRITISRKRLDRGLGPYPYITLAEAREIAAENKREVIRGRVRGTDPFVGDGSPIFRDVADTYIRKQIAPVKAERTLHSWRTSLETYVYPSLGKQRIGTISASDVRDVIDPIWNSKRSTASKVRQRISTIMLYAVASGYRNDNPAGEALSTLLPQTAATVNHRAALPHDQVAAAIATVRSCSFAPTTRLAFEFLVLTAARSEEVREATPSEFDAKNGIWCISAARMKASRDHRVPLSRQALDLLAESRQYRNESGLIFPSARGKVQDASRLRKMLGELKITGTPHGIARVSFRSWCADQRIDGDIAELCLAHVNKNRVEAAYQRSDMIQLRREVMQRWADYVSN